MIAPLPENTGQEPELTHAWIWVEVGVEAQIGYTLPVPSHGQGKTR